MVQSLVCNSKNFSCHCLLNQCFVELMAEFAHCFFEICEVLVLVAGSEVFESSGLLLSPSFPGNYVIPTDLV